MVKLVSEGITTEGRMYIKHTSVSKFQSEILWETKAQVY